MSKRHQSSRRRSYGRRQHELHERPDRGSSGSWLDLDGPAVPGLAGWTAARAMGPEAGHRWPGPGAGRRWLPAGEID